MRVRQTWARLSLLALIAGVATCARAAPRPERAPSIDNRAAAPPAATIALDRDAVTTILAEHVAARHRAEVKTLDVELHPRPDGSALVFYLYATSRFEAWKGEQKASGLLDEYESWVASDEALCRAEHQARVAGVQQRLEDLSQLADDTGDPEDEQAMIIAEHELDVLQEGPDCRAWQKYYPDFQRDSDCSPDMLGLVSGTVRPAASGASSVEFSEIASETIHDCTVDQGDFGVFLKIHDLDDDGTIEVLWIRPDNELYDLGLGDSQRATESLEGLVIDENLSPRAQWTASIPRDASTGDLEASYITRVWLGDRDQDGHADIVHEQVRFERVCACGHADLQAVQSRKPQGFKGSFTLLHEATACDQRQWARKREQDTPEPCPVVDTTVDELIYDRDARSWL